MQNETENEKSNKVREILYGSFGGNEATKFGSEMEGVTKEQYIAYQRWNKHPEVNVTNCGLFVSEINNWLGASPDGIVQDSSDLEQPSGLLEIKIPFSFRSKDLTEA